MNASESSPRSRRDRPAKPPLSRDWIIDSAVEIMRTEGLAKVTMRRVAQELDTGPASLYVYVANTAELHSAMLDRLLGDLRPSGSGPWTEQVEQLLIDYTVLLSGYPGLARAALMIRPSGEHALGLFDRLLGLLLDGDVAPDRAAWGADLLILLGTAEAAEHGARDTADPNPAVDPSHGWAAVEAAVRAADPGRLPHLAAHADVALAGNGPDRLRWAFRAVLSGIAATATITTPPTQEDHR
ncbi:TetR/AcrR family transcriptional regulator [Microlunatus soli]|uniref:TetR/AcrR family transcriptional regulator n=1 Tax=Microlunatus soli TaxID=630515 RepID=UPI0018D3B5E8|nr:TetR/AcrR family transcriptional regulator [Microlunatus soli]